ncbi:MAG: hypothetical protein ACYCYK_12645 [Candidatus Dormibacteria bacterium]
MPASGDRQGAATFSIRLYGKLVAINRALKALNCAQHDRVGRI